MRRYRVLRAVGRPYIEEGQQINRVVMLMRIWWIKRAGLDIVTVGGVDHYLPFPGVRWERSPWMDSIPLAHLFSLHSFVEARKP